MPGSFVSSTATVSSLGTSGGNLRPIVRLVGFDHARLRVPAITANGAGGSGQLEQSASSVPAGP